MKIFFELCFQLFIYFFRDDPSLRSKGKFKIDSTLGNESMFGIIVDDADEHYIKSVRFFDNNQKRYGPFSSLSSDYNMINLKTINFPQNPEDRPPFDDVRKICEIITAICLTLLSFIAGSFGIAMGIRNPVVWRRRTGSGECCRGWISASGFRIFWPDWSWNVDKHWRRER